MLERYLDSAVAGRRTQLVLLMLCTNLAAILGAFSRVGCAADTDGAQAVSELVRMWRSQEQEIHTAYIHGHRFVSGSNVIPLSREAFNDIVREQDLTSGPSAVRAVLVAVLRRAPAKDVAPFAYYQSGANRRDERMNTGYIQILDGDQTIIRDLANNQAHVFAPGQSRMYQMSLSDLRRVPSVDHFSPGPIQVISEEDGLLHLYKKGSPHSWDMLVDRVTGVFVRSTFLRNGGTVSHELWQLNHATFPGGIVFPQAIVEADYTDSGSIQKFTLTIIEDARFNEEIPPEVFQAGMTGGAILDHRNPDRLRSHLIPQRVTVPNVAAHIGVPVARAPAPRRAVLWWLVGGNLGLALLVLGAILYRRRAQSIQ